MSREIPLNKGYVAIVDDEDYEELSKYRWHAWVRSHTVYACHSTYVDGRRGVWYMHKQITGYDRTDHKNGNGLDNRRANLRAATALQNNRNRRANKVGSSMYIGVSWARSRGKWRAEIAVDGGKCKHLGYYEVEEDAARAYDRAARERDPEFCSQNFPEEEKNAGQ